MDDISPQRDVQKLWIVRAFSGHQEQHKQQLRRHEGLETKESNEDEFGIESVHAVVFADKSEFET